MQGLKVVEVCLMLCICSRRDQVGDKEPLSYPLFLFDHNSLKGYPFGLLLWS